MQKFPSKKKKTEVRKFTNLKEFIAELLSVTEFLVLLKFPSKKKTIKGKLNYLKEFIAEFCNWSFFSSDEIKIKIITLAKFI